jgi:hypothetical protein
MTASIDAKLALLNWWNLSAKCSAVSLDMLSRAVVLGWQRVVAANFHR